MKRIASVLFACIILTSISAGGVFINAEEIEFEEVGNEILSSDYIALHDGSITRVSSGNIRVDFFVRATAVYPRVGALTILIQERNGSSWRTVATYNHATTSGMMGTNRVSHGGSINRAVTAGVEYRAAITVFAGGTTGDQRSFTTNSVFG
jgi:hypothetical protein